jgi:Integrase core domain
VLTDNGKVFTERFGTHQAEVLFDRMCRENGVSPSPNRAPLADDHGKDRALPPERAQRVLADKTFASLKGAQQELDAWVADYNTQRPHQALEMATPAERFRLVPQTADPSTIPVHSEEYQKGQWVLRRVGSNRVMSVDNQMFSVGNGYKGQLVDAFADDTTIQVWHQNHLIKTVARMRKGPVRKVRADGLHVAHQAELDRGHPHLADLGHVVVS